MLCDLPATEPPPQRPAPRRAGLFAVRTSHAALVGLLVAPVHVHPFVAFTSVLFIALGAGASGALNMWWDADIDAVMRRTKGRPVPAGKVQAGEALAVGRFYRDYPAPWRAAVPA